ncbi:MAG: ATPase, T2SS/T4P/T4SS family [Acidimicrobiales bacterium]
MTEVDSVRLLASEYNLEFVDLDRFPVDPTVASVLPVKIAKQYRVVPVARKFGAPVIAISNPADVVAIDTLRTSIGREFISVVASSDQIDSTLERVYNDGGSQYAAHSAVAVAEPELDELAVLDDFTDLDDLEALGLGSLADEANAPTDHSDPLAVALGDALTRPSAPEAPQTAPAKAKPASTEDDAAKTADLVEEAVAEFEQTSGDSAAEGDSELASFPPLARALIEGERVSLEDMESVLHEHNKSGQTIARILTAKGLVTEGDLMWGMAREMGLEYVDLDARSINYSVAYMLPEATARHHNVVIIDLQESKPIVAASNPTDVFAMDDLRTIIGRSFITVVSTRSQINALIDKVYHQGGDAEAVASSAAAEMNEADEDLTNLTVVEDAPIIRYVNLLILQALNERASDIHVEPTTDNLRIRYRIDGVLHDMSAAPRAIAAAVVTRLKVMADMNIAEHRVPQDGRISLTLGNRSVDLRMATLPTIYGEKVVMRVLDKGNILLSFEDLGFDEEMLALYQGVYTKPYGTILVTGPTGSGKTTTLYATLSALNTPEKNIITVEDPVELRIKGINQVQLNARAGLNFASALKSILRSDPDIVLVGEIRDRETALITVEAALTGHLVLATLHTNDAASTPMRLVEMGLESYLVTSAVSAALAQRLARRLCQTCKEPYEPTEADIMAAGWRPEEVFTGSSTPKLFHAVGCSACSNTGYRGRKALLELLLVTEEIERLIIEGGTADDIHKLATQQGMVTLRQSGLRKAMEGETTLEEVLRVVA